MREYELTVIFRGDLEEKELEKQVKALQAVLEKAGAKVVSKNDVVKKHMAYEINRMREGNYLFEILSVDPANVAEIDGRLRVQDGVIRYLLVSKA